MKGRDDLVARFCATMPERVAEATELWLSYEQGNARSLPTLRRVLHTLKGEGHMLELDMVAEVAELAESLVDAILRSGQPTPLAGDTLLGAFEGLGMITAQADDPGELPNMQPLLTQLRAAIGELDMTRSSAGAPMVESKLRPSADVADPAVETKSSGVVKAALVGPLVHELRRLHAEQAVFHQRLRDAQGMLRALLREIEPRGSAEDLVERITKTLGYGTEVERRLSKIRTDWASNDFSVGLTLDELEGSVRRASVVSAERLLSQVVRVGRSTARTLGKDVEIRVQGDAILDSSVERRLEESLLHIVRNALDHGIETPERRRAAGKSERGSVEVRVSQSESNVHVEIVDDGGGVDVDRLRIVLAARVPNVHSLSDEALLPYLLEQGVTTTERVTSISGRGVGLDVVAREIGAAGGQIRLFSRRGEGTRIELDVPATLRGEIAVPVHSGQGIYAVPTRAVHSMVRIEHIERTREGDFLRLEREGTTELVRAFKLDALYGGDGTLKPGSTALILHRAAGIYALAVDSYDNPRPITIQRTDELIVKSELVRGVSPTADGEVMLLLDVESVYQHLASRVSHGVAERKRTGRTRRAIVVEDAPVARELLAGILRSIGLEVEEATDGRSGLALARSFLPDLILTDVEMPYMDGIEFVRELKQSPEFARTPVIVLTTAATRSNRARLEELGVTALLSKQEFVEGDLRRIVERCLRE
jgi:two-component system chemotaxis sensor kinase CheA